MKKLLLIAPALLLLSLSSCANTQATQPQIQTTVISAENPQSTLLYVDVREDSEWDAGHVAGAIHVKLGDIEAGSVSAIPKDRPVALYCHSGRRAGEALQVLQKLGYTQIQNAGGMEFLKGVTIVK